MTTDLDPRLVDAFRLALGQPALEGTETMTMEDTEGWDSFAHINLMLAIEDAFGMEFEADEIPELIDVPLIQASIARHMA